jgi:hypothetical protein
MNNLRWIKIYANNALANCVIMDIFFLVQKDYLILIPALGTTLLTGAIAYLCLQQEIHEQNARQQNG